ncbi:MAG: helix-turn-helix domain-containing protein [Candidatus Thermoplasmatota archaeon]|nr:helix-turn-helix domain-containing protein [Candidatus Thermoplasmatota archaeon]MCG2826082.1 helix-turn-helix domain-containing protein [Thermoplasmatales archaeon]
MKGEKLVKMIEDGESEKIEFKETFDKDTIETVVGFANTTGGVILIGVSDKGKVKGVQVGRDSLKDWANHISQITEPTIVPDIKVRKMEGKDIVVINIQEFPVKPVSMKGRCYKRVANSNRVMTAKEITDMYLYSIRSSWDAYPMKEAKIKDIDLKQVEMYMAQAKKTGRRKFTESPSQVLKKLNLIKNKNPTWAALLLFGRTPQRFLTQARVHCGRFKGETTIVDDNFIEKNLITQVDEVMACIKKNISVRYEITGEPQRKEIWDYPLEALREAILNAVCHRDYMHSSDILIKIYDEYISIWNPGGLPLGITIDDLYKADHPSILRNKLITQVFYDLGEVEQYGSGIWRMINACRKTGLPDPVFEETAGGFHVIFRKDIFTEEYMRENGLNERQIKAVMYVKKEGKITNKVYQNICKTSERTTTRDLTEIVHKAVFRQIGTTGKGTCYILNLPETRQRRHKDAVKTPNEKNNHGCENSQRAHKGFIKGS